MDHPASAAERYDDLASNYEENCCRTGYKIPGVLDEIIKQCMPNFAGRHALDIGCGTGLASPVILNYVQSLDGLDLSQRMLEQAAARGVYSDLSNIDLISFLTRNQQPYDLIMAISVLQELGELDQFISCALDSLRSEGWLLFNVAAGPLLGDGYEPQPEGYYTHAPQYVMKLLGELGVGGGKILRFPWPAPFPYADHSLFFAAQRVANA